MAKIPGLNISAPVVPLVDTDTYPSHRAMYGQGGWQEVTTIADRDAITAPRREAGMAVYVTSEQKVFILNNDLVTWTELVSKSLDSVRKTDTFTNFLPVEEDEIVQYVGDTTDNYTNGYFYTAVSDGEEPPTYTWTQINVQPVTEVINNLTSTSTTAALSANMGKYLQEEIEAISGRGRYLTLWNCSTGLAETNPPESPYEYRTGDYFIVGTVASAGGTNYRPDGSSYTTGVASTTVETAEVSIDDTYIYDGSTWHLQYNSQKTVTFTNIAGSPYDNTNLANALNSKVEDVRVNGTSVVENKIANVTVPTAAIDISYTNPDYPTVAAALDKLLYVAPAVSISGGGNYEIGSTRATTTLTWNWNKAITSQSLNQGIGSLDPALRTYTYETAITSDTTFTITGSDGTNSKSASTSVKFMPKRYWGVSTNTSLTDEQILALSSELSTTRVQTRTFNCSGGKYFYLVIRTEYCSGIKFKVGGLSFSDMLVTTRNVVNESGYTASYNIYRVNNIQTGNAIVVEVS